MTKTKEEQHWDAWNLGHARTGLTPVRRALSEAAAAEIRLQELEPGARLLDIGCGAGWMVEFVSSDFSYLGLDLAQSAVAAARQRVPSARFEAQDFLDWPGEGATFDAVLCIDTIAYFRDQDAAVEKMRCSLKPGAPLVLTTVNPFVYSRIDWIGPPGEGQVRKWLSKRDLFDLLRRHGLTPTRSYTILPAGNRGILRLVNSVKVEHLIEWAGVASARQLRERLGFGQFRLVVARNGDPAAAGRG